MAIIYAEKQRFLIKKALYMKTFDDIKTKKGIN